MFAAGVESPLGDLLGLFRSEVAGVETMVHVVVDNGVDVVAVAHAGYTIPAHLRTAVEVRDPKCIVPRCDHAGGYRSTTATPSTAPGSRSSKTWGTSAHGTHYMKTFLGYTYRGGPGTGEWIPPRDRDIDLSPLRKIITSARRCEPARRPLRAPRP